VTNPPKYSQQFHNSIHRSVSIVSYQQTQWVMPTIISLHTLHDSWLCPGMYLRSTKDIISESITTNRVSWRMSQSRWNGVRQYTSPRSSATRIHHTYESKKHKQETYLLQTDCTSEAVLLCCTTVRKITSEKACNRWM